MCVLGVGWGGSGQAKGLGNSPLLTPQLQNNNSKYQEHHQICPVHPACILALPVYVYRQTDLAKLILEFTYQYVKSTKN